MVNAFRLVLAVLFSVCVAGFARAQAETPKHGARFPEPSAVIVASIEKPDVQLERLAVMVEEQLRNRGYRLLSMFDAAAELNENFSAPDAAPDSLLKELEEDAQRTLMAVADGDDRDAERLADRALQKVDGYLWHIGQMPLRIGDVGNICLYKVRALWHRDKLQAAREQALRCLQLVPDLVAEPRLHPDEVRDYVREVRLRLSGEPVKGASHIPSGGKLVVHAGPGVPAGCLIHINGRPLGRAPELRFTVAAGTYQVHIGCGNYRSVVHRVELQPGEEKAVTISAGFGDHLITRPRPGFVYPSKEFFYQNHEAFSKQMAQALRTSSLFVARGGSADTATIDYYTYSLARGTLRFEASVELPYVRGAVAPSHVDQSIDALESGQSAKVEGSSVEKGLVETQLIEPEQAPEPEQEDSTFKTVAQWTTLGLGVGGLALSWVFYMSALDKQNDISNGATGSVIDDRDQASTYAMISAGAGGLVSAASLSLLWVDEERDVPWWSWAMGGVGLAVAGTGIAVWAMHGSCNQAPCDSSMALGVPMGPMLLFHALPLLSVPVAHIVKGALSDGASTGGVATNWHAMPWLTADSAGFGLWVKMP